MKELIIKTENLTKKYGNNVIFQNVNIEIFKGETIAFIGKNGTGKSTMLKVLSGLVRASDGKVEINSDFKIGYIPERFDNINFTIPEFIYHIGRLDGLSKKEIEVISEELYCTFFLEDMLTTPMKFLSKGTLQKVAVIQALLIQPDILLLDEPLSGQDYLSQKKILEKIIDLKKRNLTILMSCHEQFLIEQLADRLFKIENSIMEEVTVLNDKVLLPFNLLLFSNNSNCNSKILEDIKCNIGIHEVMCMDSMIRIIIKKENCQEVLFKMLQANFVLVKFDEI